MPKIIENLESRLFEEAKKQLFEVGYGALTIRSVAKACGVGIGTVYNYFYSKDEMISMIMLKDLEQCVGSIRQVCAGLDSAEQVLSGIYDHLVLFAKEHSSLFRDRAEAAAFLGAFNVYREWLREQLTHILRSFSRDDFSAEFVAEAMLTWTMAKKTFEEIYGVVGKLISPIRL